MLIGVRGYSSETIQPDLIQKADIKLKNPKRSNQKNYNHNLTSLKNQEKELKPFFHRYAINT